MGQQSFVAVTLAAMWLFQFSPGGVVRANDVDEAAKAAAATKFDQAVYLYRKETTREAAQTRLHQVLTKRIDSIDRCCELNAGQKQKLELAGRGAIKQLFQEIDDQRAAFLSGELGDQQKVFVFLNQGPEIGALRRKLRFGPFDEDSLFTKTLRNVLTPEQAARYEQQPVLAAKSSKRITAANARDLVRATTLDKDIYQIVFNRDGKRVGLVEIIKVATVYTSLADQPVQVFGIGKAVVGFDFSPDENRVAVGGHSKKATIINVQDGSETGIDTGQAQPSVKFSPDGKTLATGGYAKTAKLWSVETGKLIREFDVGPSEGGLTPVFSPDGTILAIGHRNSATFLFDVASGKLLHKLSRSMSQGLNFNSTGTILAVTYVNASLALWDVRTGRLTKSVSAAADELYTVDWSPNDSLLVTGGNNSQVAIWNATDLSMVQELNSPEWVISTRFSPDGTKLLFAGGDRSRQVGRRVEMWAVP